MQGTEQVKITAVGTDRVEEQHSSTIMQFSSGVTKGVSIKFLENNYETSRENVGPSRVRALPLAAGINVGGHYKGYFFSLSSLFLLLILPEGVVVGFCNFAWAPK